MQITIAAIGRLKAGPERALLDRYVERATQVGRKLGFDIAVREFPESRAGNAATRKDEESARILDLLGPKATLIALDEGGRALDSRGFASTLAKWRDIGKENTILAIGGPDGHGPALIDRADVRLAFGPMTWPHQIVRLMLAEQIYRATTILSNHPYHRD